MKNELERLCAGLAGEGTTESAGLAFTLESAKAREKLQEFALAQPENFQLLALAGLYALGSRQFAVTIDADDFVVRADQTVSREPFEDLWSFVSRGGSEPLIIGCRLLAMALLTSVRLGEMEWRIESADERGGWHHTASVRRGLLNEKKPAPLNQPEPGVLLAAKRKAMSQVARRFFSRWWSGGGGGADESLLRQRLFLPEGQLVCNGRSLVAERAADPAVLAVMTAGGAPALVPCSSVHAVERDYKMSVLLCLPGTATSMDIPGTANHTTWIWNGLRMDSTVLGAELDCMRAFVWASELHPDLSFSSLADNRDKQALERTVRSVARELLERWVSALSEEIRARVLPPRGRKAHLTASFQNRLPIVRTAIAERIDIRKDWRRFASLNRALFEFPLVLGSGPDGARVWVSMATILAELQAGRQVATFSGDGEPDDVPPWPGRPLVLYTTKTEATFLSLRFPHFELASAEKVLLSVRARLAGSTPVSAQAAPGGEWKSGELPFRDIVLKWTLARRASSPGRLLVVAPDGACFADESLSLPPGLTATAQADWQQSYRGTLADRRLAGDLCRSLLTAFSQSIASGPAQPGPEDYELAGMLLETVGDRGELRAGAMDWEWLTVRTLGGRLRRISPRELLATLDAFEAPVYSGAWSFEPPAGLPQEWEAFPVVLVPKSAEVGLAGLLKRRLHSAAAFSLLGQRPSPPWNEAELVWSGQLAQAELAAVAPGIRSLRLGVRKASSEPNLEPEIFESLWGYYLGRVNSLEISPHFRAAVDWSRGWPNNNATQRLSDRGGNGQLKAACLALAGRFLRQMTREQMGQTSPDLLGGLMFDLLSDGATASEPVFMLGDGRRVCLAQIPALDGAVRYFAHLNCQWPPHAVYLPGPMQEAIELFSDVPWILLDEQALESESSPPSLTAASDPGAPPRAASPSDPVPAVLPEPPIEPPSHAAFEPHSEGKEDEEDEEDEERPRACPIPGAEETAVEGDEVASSPAAAPVETVAIESAVVELVPQPAPGLAPPDPPPLGSTSFDLLAELAGLEIGPFSEREAFSQFLAKSRFETGSEIALRLDGDAPVLGRKCHKALLTSHGRKLLLAALFSTFRRQSESTGMQAECEFHAALLGSALKPSRR